jgi:hypothetical protein
MGAPFLPDLLHVGGIEAGRYRRYEDGHSIFWPGGNPANPTTRQPSGNLRSW